MSRAAGGQLSSINVVIVEPQALVRAGFSLILSACDDIRVVGEGDNAQNAANLVHQHKPDVLCLAVRLTDGDARDVIASLRDLGDPMPYVLLLTGRKDAALAENIRHSGGIGVLSKYSVPEEIVESVRQAARLREGFGDSPELRKRA